MLTERVGLAPLLEVRLAMGLMLIVGQISVGCSPTLRDVTSTGHSAAFISIDPSKRGSDAEAVSIVSEACNIEAGRQGRANIVAIIARMRASKEQESAQFYARYVTCMKNRGFDPQNSDHVSPAHRPTDTVVEE